MSLRELTAASHAAAENTYFMRAFFANDLPLETWTDFMYQKWVFYSVLEDMAEHNGVLDGLPGIQRASLILKDYLALNSANKVRRPSVATLAYIEYLMSLTEPEMILAHIYTWHMGDMHGGQLIAKTVPVPHVQYTFADRSGLIKLLREKLNDGMATEANIAFGFALNILNEYAE